MIGPVSVKSCKKYLLTIMDAFSRYADAIPMEGKSAREVSEALTISLTGVFGGAPLTIVADRGMEFVGHVTRTAMSMLGHTFRFIPADLHQSNMVERFDKTLTSMIRAIRTEGVKQWVPAVRMALQYYNHKVHASTGHTPVEIHLGSVVDPDPDPYGSVSFGRIRIRFRRSGSGSGLKSFFCYITLNHEI